MVSGSIINLETSRKRWFTPSSLSRIKFLLISTPTFYQAAKVRNKKQGSISNKQGSGSRTTVKKQLSRDSFQEDLSQKSEVEKVLSCPGIG